METMETKLAQQLSNLIVSTIDNDMRQVSGNNYTISDYIDDFSGTATELDVQLIQMAANLL